MVISTGTGNTCSVQLISWLITSAIVVIAIVVWCKYLHLPSDVTIVTIHSPNRRPCDKCHIPRIAPCSRFWASQPRYGTIGHSWGDLASSTISTGSSTGANSASEQGKCSEMYEITLWPAGFTKALHTIPLGVLYPQGVLRLSTGFEVIPMVIHSLMWQMSPKNPLTRVIHRSYPQAVDKYWGYPQKWAVDK